jgi:hypothetical protein
MILLTKWRGYLYNVQCVDQAYTKFGCYQTILFLIAYALHSDMVCGCTFWGTFNSYQLDYARELQMHSSNIKDVSRCL